MWRASITISAQRNRLFATYRYIDLANLTTNQVDIGGALAGDTLGTPAAARAARPSCLRIG